MGYKRETVEVLKEFRQNMGSDFYLNDAKRIFRSTISSLPEGGVNEISEKKLQYAKGYIKYLKFLNLVKFIGVTGSVGAGIAKDEDDIDFIIVVKNNTLWIYRGFMFLKNIFNKKMSYADTKEKKDLICPNLIVEERGLRFDKDVFNLHELYYLKPIYNEEYYPKILSSNQWLKEWGGVIEPEDSSLKKVNIFLEAINLYFFIPQILFMWLKKHSPEVRRIIRNYIRGRIEFYPHDFKGKILSKLKSI